MPIYFLKLRGYVYWEDYTDMKKDLETVTETVREWRSGRDLVKRLTRRAKGMSGRSLRVRPGQV